MTRRLASQDLAAAVKPLVLTESERRWLWLTDLPFLPCALAAAVWLPAQRPLDALVCLALVAALAAAANLCVPMRGGHAPATQLVFVPMLFLAPLHLVPLLVLAGLLLGSVPQIGAGARAPSRSLLCFGDSWYVLGPVLVLAVAGNEAFAWSSWPTYAAAFAAQVGVGLVAGMRVMLDDEAPRDSLREIAVVPGLVDVVLSIPALSAVAISSDAPVAAALTLGALLVLAGGFTTERSARLTEHDHATRDALTGLPNRRLFDELAAAAAERARRDGEPCAVMLVDLNDFKGVNDELGHETGDRVLVQAAERLRSGVRSADTVARLGGDEFALLLAGHQTPDACDEVARKLRMAFGAPFDLPGGPRQIGVAVGAALVDGDAAVELALRAADVAMYVDKQAQGTFRRRESAARAAVS